MAAAAGNKNARLPHAIQLERAGGEQVAQRWGDVRFNGPRINAPRAPISAGGNQRASSILVHAYSDSAVYVAFAVPAGNQFANVRVVGQAQWQTLAPATGNVQIDTTGDISGSGHLTVGGNLTGSASSSLELEGLELVGVMADSGVFAPDTTVFSGATQTLLSQFGNTSNISYNNVVVNATELDRTTDDNDIELTGSLFIMNSGQLRLGVDDANCHGCDSDVYVDGNFETHNSGVLRMNDVPLGSPEYLAVHGNALFAGGNTCARASSPRRAARAASAAMVCRLMGLLTQGEIDYFQNVTQSGPTTTAYAATSPHLSYFTSRIPSSKWSRSRTRRMRRRILAICISPIPHRRC